MNKNIKKIFYLIVILLIIRLIVFIVNNDKDTDYIIKTKNNNYKVNENYHKYEKKHIYTILIEDKKKNKFLLDYNLDLNKKVKIIKDIKEYKEKNLYCIAPILKDDNIESISCLLNKKQVSQTFLKQQNNKSLDKFIKNLEKKGYKFNNKLNNDNKIIKKVSNIKLYDTKDKKLYLTMWGYKGIYILNNKNIDYKKYLIKDTYFNKHSILCDKYYVSLDLNNKTKKLFIVDIIKQKVKEIDLDFYVSKDSYFNGVYKNNLYLTDINNKTQYVIDLKKKTIKENENKAEFYDGTKMKKVDISELTEDKKYFVNEIIDKEVLNEYKSYKLIPSDSNYYYKDKHNNIYQVSKVFPEYKILLFNFNEFKDMKVINDSIFGIVDDTVYMYNNKQGLNKIASNRELSYNYKNIYDIYYN